MIVHAQPVHLSAIVNIYNQAIQDGFRTAHLNPLTPRERREWFEAHNKEKYPVFVWLENDKVLGWLSISPYRSGRGALDEVAEVSYYIDYAHHGKGIATGLMSKGIEFCKQKRFRILVAILISDNNESIGLARKFGFEEAGRIKDAIHFQDKFSDHVYMSLKIK